MKSRASIFFIILVSLLGQINAAEIPDMVLQTVELRIVDTKNLKTDLHPSQTIYRVSKGELYISSPDREEYHYGKLKEVEHNRFTSAHYTIIFTSSDFKEATLIHSNDTHVKISRIRSIKT